MRLPGHDGERLGFTGSGPVRRVEALLTPPSGGASPSGALVAVAATGAAVAGFVQLFQAWMPAA
jgi:hypothetical protein